MFRYRSFVWFCWFLLVLPGPSRTLELHELLPFGPGAGDRRLEPGTDRTEELRLNGTVLLFRDSSDLVHINTNGFVSFVAPPPEDEYLGKMPAGFKLVAALLGDLDDGGGQGGVYFREDSSPAVLHRVTEHVRAAFPRDDDVEPDSVLIVTWDKMVAAGTADGVDGSSAQRNTFQLVVAFSASSSYAVLLYPRDGLQFLSTSVGGERKLLEVGFNEGLVQGWFWQDQGTYFRATTDEEASIRELTEKTNSGQRGVWVYEIGASPYFFAITPGMVSSLPEDKEPLVTMLPRKPDEPQVVDVSENPDEAQTTSTEAGLEPVFPTESPIESGTEAESFTTGFVTSEHEGPQLGLEQLNSEHPESQTPAPAYTDSDKGLQTYPESRSPDQPESRSPDQPESRSPDQPESRYPDQPESRYPDQPESRYPDQPESRSPDQPESRSPDQPESRSPDQPESRSPDQPESRSPDQPESRYPDQPESRNNIPEPIEPRYSPVEPRYPDPEESQYNNPEPIQPAPPHSHPEHPHIVVVDEDLDVNVFSYNLETCANNRHKCSAFADCRDHSNGFCCHCRPGFYGNGKDCVAEGKPQRMNGKVSGRVFVGDSSSAVEFSNKDLHSYVVANDGRAYVAISNIPKSWGPSLQPLSSLGGVIGWAFALEQPGHHNGFSIVGGVFSRQAEVLFQPGNERLSIRQEFRGIDEHDHLVVSTELEGRLPAVPLGASVHINPYKEIYHYDQNLITSSSNREYVITFPDGDVQTRSYQWRQSITFQSCVHDEASRVVASTQQLTVDQVFVMFDPDNDLIRYAMSNKIGSVHSVAPEQNPCFTGRHGCDLNAVCRPADGLQFSCKCAAGFTGDGRYCHDIDECLETPDVCGSNAICSNQPGSFHCECSAGYVFASDGRTCIEDGRPVDHCLKGTHDCDVAERAVCSYGGGSAYFCSCLPGFVGDGRVCQDVDECQEERCHRDAVCSNTQGSFTCHCRPGFHGDGVQCSVTPSEHEKTPCERQRDAAQPTTTSFFSLWRWPTAPFIPQCDAHGSYESTQCHSAIGQCWCVDADGHEIPNTRTGAANAPLCINQAVTLPPVGPTPRPDVDPAPPGTNLLFAQSGRIERVPLDGHHMRTEDAKPLLHVPDRVVIAVAYDCVDEMVYWSDITAPAISRARLSGGDVVPLVTKELQSPEGLAVDHVSRLLFWTDSVRDTVEVSQLDGSHRRVLFDTDLVNPRPIVTNPVYGRLFWADWDRDGPKIETSNMDGTDRSVLVKDDLGLPNGLTFDLQQQQLCWADAGTRRLECIDPQRRLRRRIVEQIQYPFAVVAVGRNLFYTDWRREAVVAVDRHSEEETEEFLPQKRSRLYGIAAVSTLCPQVYNYCANNGGCSHLCLPRAGGFSCRCPDADAAVGRCVETNP